MQFFQEEDMKGVLGRLLPERQIGYMPHDHQIDDEYNKELSLIHI